MGSAARPSRRARCLSLGTTVRDATTRKWILPRDRTKAFARGSLFLSTRRRSRATRPGLSFSATGRARPFGNYRSGVRMEGPLVGRHSSLSIRFLRASRRSVYSRGDFCGHRSAAWATTGPGNNGDRTDAGCGVSRYPKLGRSEEHTSELQSHVNLVCRLLLEKKKKKKTKR